MLLRLTVILFVYLFFAAGAFADNDKKALKGKVRDAETNEPCIGASVVIEGSANGTAAGLEGDFVINNLPAGTYTVVVSYIGYETLKKTGVVIENGKDTEIELLLTADGLVLETVKVVARANRESESVLIMEQRQSLVSIQAAGARELSRKGIGDARAAVAQVSGISHQEGVKNVFVRGLGDRYNATLLNGFPIPSEDPEYKNIALEFFGTDIIQNISVSKAFSGRDYSDAGGAIVNITSKELAGDNALSFDVSGGVNTSVMDADFITPDGANYFGLANTAQPSANSYNFVNSLDPAAVPFAMNHSYGISGGKLYKTGANANPLSFFVSASHSSNYSYTEETIRNSNTAGVVWQNQTGRKYSQDVSQLVFANAIYTIGGSHHLQYNFMLVHAVNRYAGEYSGYNGETYQDSPDYIGTLHRQQINDNLLLVNQLSTDFKLAERLNLDAGASYSTVKGNEPDRRANNFSRQQDGSYSLTKSNRQQRFFSALTDGDITVKAALTYRLKDGSSDNSSLKAGYSGRFSDNNFEAVEYNFSALSGMFNVEEVRLDDMYNQANLDNKQFRMSTGLPNTYHVTKRTHSVFGEASYQLLPALAANAGFRSDMVDMTIDYHVQHTAAGNKSIRRNFYLPSINLKYDINGVNTLRLGVGKTYTLPQSKEISPYQYVNISFASQGNPNIEPSDNYNIDLKWDCYIAAGELISLTGFAKYIKNPIGRVDEGNSAGLLTYNNIADHATVGGVELEARRNILNRINAQGGSSTRFSVGLNASYIYTSLLLNIRNTEARNSRLEGASPFIANADVSYSYTKDERNFTAAFVFNCFSNRIHTIGAGGFNDIIEQSVATLDFAVSYRLSRRLLAKAKVSNITNPAYRLTRQSSQGETVTLNEFRKGQGMSIGINIDL
ncbi:MAG: TonB-dependent receptor [Cytophagaceae bacterium]|jgi:hypothetical protein|nr:TonB-dependent receptor [Cytophagaceae bacterium]